MDNIWQLQPVGQNPNVTANSTLPRDNHLPLNIQPPGQRLENKFFERRDYSLIRKSRNEEWLQIIHEHCKLKKTAIFLVQEVERRSSDEIWHMNSTVSELVWSEHIKTMEADTNSNFIQKSFHFGYSCLVTTPVSWVSKRFMPGSTSSDIQRGDERYVLLAQVTSIADSVHSFLCDAVNAGRADNMFLKQEVFDMAGKVCTDEISFDMAVEDLCRRNICVRITTNKKEEIIRLTQTGESPVLTKTEVMNPTETDISIMRLRSTKTRLEQLNVMKEEEMKQCQMALKESFANGNKHRALVYQRKVNFLEKSSNEREAQQDKIEELIYQLEFQKQQEKVVSAVKMGVEAFAEMYQKNGITPDFFDETMFDIKEVFLANEEISGCLEGAEKEDLDLELELEDLLASRTVSCQLPVRQETHVATKRKHEEMVPEELDQNTVKKSRKSPGA